MQNTDTPTAEEMIAKGKAHDEDRIKLDWYYVPVVEEWVSLHHRAGLMSRDDSLRGYSYYQTNDDSVVFYSEGTPSYFNDRGDSEPYDEKYIAIPFTFISGDGDTDRERLAEMIKAKEKADAEMLEQRKAGRSLSY